MMSENRDMPASHSARCRLAELLLLCARIGFNP